MLHNAPQHKPLTGYCSCVFMMIVALISVVILLTFVGDIWRIRTSTTVHATVQAWKRPRPLGQQQTGRQATQWEQAARANLSSYRGNLLSHIRPYYGKNDFWSVFLPVISCPSDRPLTRYGGTGDGSKLLCKVPGQLQQEGCVVYSFGSKGHYGFEEAMLNATACQVYTFDCTYNGTSQHARHSYYKWCLGDPKDGGQYRTWKNLTDTLGHHKVNLLKMDIEGYEHQVLPTWHPDDILPDELSIELHAGINPNSTGWPTTPQTTAELALTFVHLTNLGFVAYAQEVNAGAPQCCSEFTFMRLQQ